MGKLKNRIKNNKLILSLRRTFGKNKKKVLGKNNKVCIFGLMKNSKIFVKGNDNKIEILSPKINVGLNIMMIGNHNKIEIKENCVLKDLNIWIEDDCNSVLIEKDTLICGNTKLSLIEGTSIVIGEGSMFSDGIDVRTGDSHSIVDTDGKRINPSKDVVIGKHCWIGHGASILKGVKIGDNCIVATKAVVTKTFVGEKLVIAGNPSRVVKENVNWLFERI